ncbi:unnamed protein product, partial [Mycena citricolor]
ASPQLVEGGSAHTNRTGYTRSCPSLASTSAREAAQSRDSRYAVGEDTVGEGAKAGSGGLVKDTGRIVNMHARNEQQLGAHGLLTERDSMFIASQRSRGTIDREAGELHRAYSQQTNRRDSQMWEVGPARKVDC